MDKKYKLIRARLMVPLREKGGFETRIEDGYVLTEGKRIKEANKYYPGIGERILKECGKNLLVIGAEKEKQPLEEKDIPCLDGVILPGFVKAHGHNEQSLMIGVARDEPFTEWLYHAVFIFAGFLTEKAEGLYEIFGKSARYITFIKALLDDIYYGITTAMNHHCGFSKYHIPDMVEAIRVAGTKLIVAVGSSDRNYDPRLLDTPEGAVKRLDDYTGRFGDREGIWIIPGPDSVFSNTSKMLQGLKEWSREHDTLFHMHSSEEPKTTRWFYKKYLCTPVECLHRAGILDENTILAHQVHNTPIDIDVLAATGTGIVHNPLGNAILGDGMTPVIEMMDREIPVVISTDGSGSSDCQNILAAARLASQYQKAYYQDAHLLPAQQLLEMVTVRPAKMLRLNTGSLEEGMDADVILIDLSRPNLTPSRKDNVVENLIWASDGSEVRWVIANGKLLKDDYSFTTLDEEEIKAEARQLSDLMIEYRATQLKIKVTGARQDKAEEEVKESF